MKSRPEVLIVGAGPVGLLAALRLSQSGVGVSIIDQEPRAAAHSYACGLHPNTLKLLDETGLASETISQGRSLHSLVFHDKAGAQAEIHFNDLPAEFPFVLVLAQSALEDLLERKLFQEGGGHVRWSHRLRDLRFEGQSVQATIEKLVQRPPGSRLEDTSSIRDVMQEEYEYVIGADGKNSLVRDLMGISYDLVGEDEAFAVYEFMTETALPHQVWVVLGEHGKSVLWPLCDERCRWSFQLPATEVLGERKSQWDSAATYASMQKGMAENANKLLQERAPWFDGTIREIEWWAGAYFEKRVAERFGGGRCWLAGDAAHQTSPVGVQSLNLGLKEAAILADAIAIGLQQGGAEEILRSYGGEHRSECCKLLKGTGLEAVPGASPWVANHETSILPSIPASGQELDILLEQIGLRFKPGLNRCMSRSRVIHETANA